MNQPSFFDNVREWIGSVAFTVYLWSNRMTKEEFWAEQDRQAVEHLRAVDGAVCTCEDSLDYDGWRCNRCGLLSPHRQ